MIRAIVFDVFGTVVDWRGSLIGELQASGLAPAADWVGLVDAWRGAYAPSMDRVRRGELPWTKLDALHRSTLEVLAPRFGAGSLSEAERAWVNEGWQRLNPWPDSVAGLTRLRERFVIGPLSNGNVSLLVHMARRAALPWDVVFSAELFGHYKPDPETYLGACRLLSLEPGEVMLCAAHNSDLAAAQRAGLRTAFIPRPLEYGPLQTRDFGPEGDWDVVARDLVELGDQLRS